MKKTLMIFLLITSFVSCSNQKYDNKRPADFSFKFIAETNTYDSKTGSYRQKYTEGDSVIKVSVTQKELDTIYELFKKCDFMAFPNKFECDSLDGPKFPAFETTVEVTYKGTNKRVTNSDLFNKKIEQQKSNNFDEFSSAIRRIIYNKTEIKNMRDCDIVFM